MSGPTNTLDTPNTPIDKVIARFGNTLLDQHAKWLASGGEELLKAVTNMYRGDAWPWQADSHQQASFGAFMAGVDSAVKYLANLQVLLRDRNAMIERSKQMLSHLNAQTQHIMLLEMGYTEDELKKYYSAAKKG